MVAVVNHGLALTFGYDRPLMSKDLGQTGQVDVFIAPWMVYGQVFGDFFGDTRPGHRIKRIKWYVWVFRRKPCHGGPAPTMPKYAHLLPMSHGSFYGFSYLLHFAISEKLLVVTFSKNAERKRAECSKAFSPCIGAAYENVVIAGIDFFVRVSCCLVLK